MGHTCQLHGCTTERGWQRHRPRAQSLLPTHADGGSHSAALIDAGAVATHEQVHYESERRGEVPGDHTVVFRSDNERIDLGHSVTTRDVFAAGALQAAAWVAGQENGLYSMQDVLFDA